MPNNEPLAIRQEFAEAIAEIMRDMDLHIAAQLSKAKLCRSYYLALIKEGFSEPEALEICKHFKMEA